MGLITSDVPAGLQQARAKELRLELINSQRLAAHFEQHPSDLALLKHDKALAKKPEAPHLKHLPSYLRAAGLPASTGPGKFIYSMFWPLPRKYS